MRLLTLAVLTLMVALPARADAHAVLLDSSPAPGDRLDGAPAEVTLRFSEEIRLLDPRQDADVTDERGQTALAAVPLVPPEDRHRLRFTLRPGLEPSTYTVRYRIVGEDSHVIPGAFVFGIGVDELTAPIADGAGSGPSEGGLWGTSSRLLHLVTLSLLFGLLLVRRFVWEPSILAWQASAGEAARITAWGREGFWLAFGLLAIGAMIAEGFVLLVRSAAAAGAGVLSTLGDPASMSAVLGETSFGQAVQWRALLLFVLFGLATWQYLDETRPARVAAPPGGRRLPWLLMALTALAIFAGLAAGAHAALAPLAPLQVAAHTLHASAAAFWTAGLAVIAWAAWRVPRLAPGSGASLASGLLARWGTVAGAAVVLLVLTGVIRVAGQLASPAQLWEIDYGRVVLAKVALLLVAGGIALGNRRLARAITGSEAPPRRALRLLALRAGAELGVLLVAFVVVAVLVVQVPGRI